MIILGPAVPVSGGVLHSPVVTAGLVTELDVEGVATRHLQLGEVQLSLVLTTVELVVVLNLTQLSLLSPDKLTGVILDSFTLHSAHTQSHSAPTQRFEKINKTYSFTDGDGDVLHGITGVRVQVRVNVHVANHCQLRVGLDVVVDVYLHHCHDN